MDKHNYTLSVSLFYDLLVDKLLNVEFNIFKWFRAILYIKISFNKFETNKLFISTHNSLI